MFDEKSQLYKAPTFLGSSKMYKIFLSCFKRTVFLHSVRVTRFGSTILHTCTLKQLTNIIFVYFRPDFKRFRWTQEVTFLFIVPLLAPLEVPIVRLKSERKWNKLKKTWRVNWQKYLYISYTDRCRFHAKPYWYQPV